MARHAATSRPRQRSRRVDPVPCMRLARRTVRACLTSGLPSARITIAGFQDCWLPTSGATSACAVRLPRAGNFCHASLREADPNRSGARHRSRMRSSQDSAARHRDVLAACTSAAWEAHFGSDDPVVAGLRPLAAVSERRIAQRTPTARTDTREPLRRRGARYGARSLGRRLALTGALAVLVTAGALGGTAQAALPGVPGDVAGTATAAVQQVAPAQPAAPTTEAAAPVADAAKPVTEAAAPVTQAVAEVAKPAAEAAAPVTQKVTEAAKPVADAAAPATQKVTDTAKPVADAAAPATKVVTDTAAPVTKAAADTTAPVAKTVADVTKPVVDTAAAVTKTV